MPLVFAGVCSHAPGIVGRAQLAAPEARDGFYAALAEMRARLRASRPDALIVVAAEHFGNFFMNNMPAFAMALTDHYEGPIEDEAWLGIRRRRIAGNRDLALRLITGVMRDIDLAYAEEWKLDHG